MINHDEIKTFLILNPAAGKGKGKKNFSAIHNRIKEKFPLLITRVSEYPGHLLEIGKEAIDKGYQRIISIGGDGTPFELINGLYANGKPPQKIELAMIPAGRGNAFLRDFGDISQERWVNAALGDNTRTVDLIEFQYMKDGQKIKKYFINIMGIGLIADILKLTNEHLKFLGSFGYNLAVLIRLFKGMNNQMTITIDGQPFEINNSALVFSNSKYTGDGMKIAPMADTSDGKVDMVLFQQVNRREIIDIFLKVFKGTHVLHPKVKTFSGIEFEIQADYPLLLMADGEMLGETPMKLKTLPNELTLLV